MSLAPYKSREGEVFTSSAPSTIETTPVCSAGLGSVLAEVRFRGSPNLNILIHVTTSPLTSPSLSPVKLVKTEFL